MLKLLKRKFIIFVTGLVSLVLLGVVASSLWSSYLSVQSSIDSVLEEGLETPLTEAPSGRSRNQSNSGLFVVTVETSSSGIVLATSNASLSTKLHDLDQIIAESLDVEKGRGYASDLGIAWKSRKLQSGNVLITMVNAGDLYQSWERQSIRSIASFIIALAAVAIISVYLADWATAPIEEAFQKQQRFVGDASHELKTPLAVILANGEILMKSHELSAKDRRWVKSISDEAEHMKSLVGELLQLARTDEGLVDSSSFAFRMESIDFSDMVGSASLEFDALAFERNCTIETELQEGVLVNGDREWVDRLVKILMDNACKYAYDGSLITVRLTFEKRKNARLSITNRGEPIAPEDLKHIFDRFYRSDNSRSRTDSPGGFGLGLAIARGIAEAHGGTISATSTTEEGTTFSVTLPASLNVT